MFNRRTFMISSAALFSAPIAPPVMAAPVTRKSMWNTWDAQVTPASFDPYKTNPWDLHARFLPQKVRINDGLTPGDIHVDAVARYLYHIGDDGTAMRYGVAIARGDLYAPGIYTIRRKAKWPVWTPTAAMIKREPHKYKQHAGGMDGGPANPLGSRALYLYRGKRDTYLRIHGTPTPRSIGLRASSGCVRMVMAHINHLYESVDLGVRAHFYSPDPTITARS